MNREECTLKKMMDFIVNNRVENLPANAISDVFDALCWCFDDNGSAITDNLRQWLFSDDLFKVEIALNQNFVYFFESTEEHTSKYMALLNKWPNLKEEINKKLNSPPPQ